MFRYTATTLRAAAIAIPALLATSIAGPVAAQSGVSISYNDFHNRLAPYGTWSNNPRWGEVWHPTRVESGFRPYYNGHWEDTNEYGWLWVSDESWGDVPYHYGRWVSDPREGWLWVPGYVWGPSWVVWRSGGGNIGWFPMPPDDNYYGDGAYRDNYDNQYGYRDWYGPSFGSAQFLSLWIFVGEDHFRDRNFRNYAVPQRDYGRFMSQTRNTTHYVTINNYVVNRSIDESRLQQATNQRFQPVPASNVLGRNALVTQANVGRQVEQRERQQHPIPANINPTDQRGRGNVNQNVQPQTPDRAPPDAQRRGGNRNQGPNDAGQANPQTDRVAPVANTPRQNPNQAQQDAQGRVGNRNQAPNNSGQVTPQTDRVAPVANTPQQNPNQAQQDAQSRGGNRNQGANRADQTSPQAARGAGATPPAPVANTPPPNGNAASQGLAERRNGGQTNPQTDRAIQSSQAPQRRGAPEQNAVVQDNRTPTRVQENVPAANSQGNARNNQARGNSQGDAKNAGQNAAAEQKIAADKKAADDKKKADENRRQN